MSLHDQYQMARTPLKPLPYKNKELAQNSEFMIDYVGDKPNYHLYIVDAEDSTKIIDITAIMIREAFGNDLTVNIDGQEEPISLHDLLNFIYKRFLYPDNPEGFDYSTDGFKLNLDTTKIVLQRNTDGTYFLPVTTADAVYDKYGNNIQDRLDKMARLGFAMEYIKATEENQSVFEFSYPFLNYMNYGNYFELRIGTVFIDRSRYQYTENFDEDGNAYGATITFFNETIEYDRRIDIFFIYNATDVGQPNTDSINGGQITRGSISYNKLEKVSDQYTLNDGSAIASAKAVYNLYSDFSDAINNANGSSYFVMDQSDLATRMEINLSPYGTTMPDSRYILLNIIPSVKKNANFDLNVRFADRVMTYSVITDSGVPMGRMIKILINASMAKPLTLVEDMLTTTRYIYTCEDAETTISYRGLEYAVGAQIYVYRNGVKLFPDLDYSINKADETIELFVRTELDERIVFEALGF